MVYPRDDVLEVAFPLTKANLAIIGQVVMSLCLRLFKLTNLRCMRKVVQKIFHTTGNFRQRKSAELCYYTLERSDYHRVGHPIRSIWLLVDK